MRIEQRTLPVTSLELNRGQIDGLPSNPRQWTQEDIERLARSLEETPELFAVRPLLVVPFGKKFVILGGNLRYEASLHNRYTEIPVAILYDLPTDKMAQIVLKDNGVFGSWNYSLLAQEWQDMDLEELGIEVPDLEDFGEKNKELNVDEYSENIILRLHYAKPVAAMVKNRLGENKKETLLEALGYGNEEN